MWTLRTYSGQEFHLTDEQKAVYLKAIESGAKIVNFGKFVLSNNFEFIMSEEQAKEEKLLANPIINDEDFNRWINGSNRAAEILDQRYSSPKYNEYWVEARRHYSSLRRKALPEAVSEIEDSMIAQFGKD